MKETFADRVHFARRRRGLTQTELAKRIGVGNVTISRIEKGYVERVQMETLVALARELKVSTDYLLGLTDEFPEEELELAGWEKVRA